MSLFDYFPDRDSPMSVQFRFYGRRPEEGKDGHWMGGQTKDFDHIMDGSGSFKYFVPRYQPRIFVFEDGSMMLENGDIVCGSCGQLGHHNNRSDDCMVERIMDE